MATEAHIKPSALDKSELDALSVHEQVIERGMVTFQEVGSALAYIKSHKLYRDGYTTFEAYCQERWGMTKSRANQLTSAAKLAGEIETATAVSLPNERTAREVARVPAAQRAEVVKEAANTGTLNGPGVRRIAGEAAKRQGPPPPVNTIDAEPLIDPAGREYSDPKVMEALGHTTDFEKIVNELNGLRRKIENLAKHPFGKELRVQSIQTDFKNISRAVRFATPHTTCPYMPNCEDGCNLCGGARWVTKEQWERVPEEDR